MYRLNCLVQNYDWGKFGSDSLVAEILNANGGQVDSHKTYAEYWMGTHVNGPSYIKINDEVISLSDHLKNKYEMKQGLPFLFKVLSIKDALSIQAHPDKQFAEVLNSIDSAHYKDDNHKPELAIAISEKFKLLYGIVGLEEAVNLSKSLVEYLSANEKSNFFNLLNKIIESYLLFTEDCELNDSKKNSKNDYFNLICEIIKLNEQEIKQIIENVNKNISSNVVNHKFKLFKNLFEKFGYDRGVIFSLFMNYFEMKKGDALFIKPNIPHAYLEGDCIECMANSDNVIRLGLTPKFVDTENFLKVIIIFHLIIIYYKILDKRFYDILENSFTRIGEKISDNEDNILLFKNENFKEFFVNKITLDSSRDNYNYYSDNFSILIILNGELKLSLENSEEVIKSDEKSIIYCKKYETIFIEKGSKIRLNSSNCEVYIASF